MPEYYTLDKSITRDEIETAHYGLYEIEGTRREGRRYEPRENAFVRASRLLARKQMLALFPDLGVQ